MTQPSSNRWKLLAVVSASLLLVTLDNSVLYTVLPTLTKALAADPTQALWIINVYPLVMAGLLLGMGPLGDRVGHREMFLGGLVVFGVASTLAAFSLTAPMLIGARVLLAVGASAMMPATLALIRLSFTIEHERNIAIAVWGCTSIVGIALGPIVGGTMLRHFSWGSVFLLNVPIVVVAVVAGYFVAERRTRDLERPWDLVSSIQVLVALSGLVVAIESATHSPPDWRVFALALPVASVAAILFVRRQLRIPAPLLDFSIFRNPLFMAGVFAASFAMFTMAGIQLATTQRYQLVAGFSPLDAGFLVSAAALGSLFGALIGGAMLYTKGLRMLISGGLAIAAVGVLVAPLGISAGLPWMIVGMVLTGFGLGAVMTAGSAAIMSNVPVHQAGMASSVDAVSYELGSLFGVTVLGSLLARHAAASAGHDSVGMAMTGPASMDFDSGYLLVMRVIAGVLLAGSFVTASMLRHRGPLGATKDDGSR